MAASASKGTASDAPPVLTGLGPAESLQVKKENLANNQKPEGERPTTHSWRGVIKPSQPASAAAAAEPVYCVPGCVLKGMSKALTIRCDGLCWLVSLQMCLAAKDGLLADSEWFCPYCKSTTGQRGDGLSAPSDKRQASQFKRCLQVSSAPLGPRKQRKKDDAVVAAPTAKAPEQSAAAASVGCSPLAAPCCFCSSAHHLPAATNAAAASAGTAPPAPTARSCSRQSRPNWPSRDCDWRSCSQVDKMQRGLQGNPILARKPHKSPQFLVP